MELPYNNSNVLEKFDNEETDTQVPEKTAVSNMSQYSILLVDDNTDFLNYLYSEVRPLFKNVLKAVNGEEALLILKTHQPDLIVSDVMMPIMNGYKLCKEVK